MNESFDRPQETFPEPWQRELLGSYTSVDGLSRAGMLTPAEAARLRPVEGDYRIRIPAYYAALMDNSPEGRESCPIRAQALPSLGELDPELPEWAREWSVRAYGRPVPWTADAIGDVRHLAAPRVTHRYGARSILHLSSLCALYCRFCFRKSHLNDAERSLYDGSLSPAIEYLASRPEIREIILTGGDPLSLPDSRLHGLLERLDAIDHIKTVRIHSRMPVTLPSRLTGSLLDRLSERRCHVVLVSHFNHPRECTAEARSHLRLARRRGLTLYNQSVLLRGVNASSAVLGSLFQELYESGVTPFYLHHPDWTPGTFHFRVSIERGRRLMSELAGRLSGPAMPRYVLDLPGGDGKVSLQGDAVQESDRRRGDGIGGALHEITLPHTRATGDRAVRAKVLYAEFWKE